MLDKQSHGQHYLVLVLDEQFKNLKKNSSCAPVLKTESSKAQDSTDTRETRSVACPVGKGGGWHRRTPDLYIKVGIRSGNYCWKTAVGGVKIQSSIFIRAASGINESLHATGHSDVVDNGDPVSNLPETERGNVVFVVLWSRDSRVRSDL